MGRPAQRLELEGVRLRRWRPADADVLHAAVAESLDHLSPWLAWARPGYTRADAVEFLVHGERDWASGQAYHYAIVAPDGAVVGSCGLMSRPGEGLEIGYWLHPGYTGRGIATRAAAAVAAEAFRVGAGRVQIKHDEANVRSGRVPARLGFTRVARCPALEPVTAAGDSGIDLVWRLDRPAVTGRRRPYHDRRRQACDDRRRQACDDRRRQACDDRRRQACDDRRRQACDDRRRQACDDRPESPGR